jgi:hypothetical protein
VLPPWRPRGVLIRGTAEALADAASPAGEPAGPIIQLHPAEVISWGNGVRRGIARGCLVRGDAPSARPESALPRAIGLHYRQAVGRGTDHEMNPRRLWGHGVFDLDGTASQDNEQPVAHITGSARPHSARRVARETSPGAGAASLSRVRSVAGLAIRWSAFRVLVIRTLALLTRFRGAERGANDRRGKATSGHIQHHRAYEQAGTRSPGRTVIQMCALEAVCHLGAKRGAKGIR